ncbi:hypothetical protein Q4595_27940, partial [Wenyingzhuangia sp. 1_MG-2023]|nr:hypothetical protein [Wenyingzhuangia sp. 1_MG-2023]
PKHQRQPRCNQKQQQAILQTVQQLDQKYCEVHQYDPLEESSGNPCLLPGITGPGSRQGMISYFDSREPGLPGLLRQCRSPC